MSTTPVICFGQQPCGFFPRRFLFAKIQTARRLRAEIGGEIVFFYHDSDHDPRETNTILRHRKTGEALRLNFAYENKMQRKFSPLFAKRIAAGWQGRTALQLPPFVEERWVEAFAQTAAANPADFCLEMYRRWANGALTLHEGGHSFITVPKMDFGKEQISPARDTRLRWMQSVLHCTHYIAGAGEQAYLCASDAPEITFVKRDPIDRSDEAYTELPP